MNRAVFQRLTFCRGFTLVELALVLLIVSILIGGLLVPLATQDSTRRATQTLQTLNEAREALLGFAAAAGRLPCPASATSNGRESFCDAATGVCTVTTIVQSHGRCANPYDGFVPAGTLGIGPVNTAGQLLDDWGRPIRYAVPNVQDATLVGRFYMTAAGGMSERWKSILPEPDLRICSTSQGIKAPPAFAPDDADCAGPSQTFVSSAAAVIYSLGKNAAAGGTSGDESHNPNPNSAVAADRAFVHHEPFPYDSAAPEREFDDVLIWLSPNLLYSRLVAVGKLP